MKPSPPCIDEILQSQIQIIAPTVRPRSLEHYQTSIRSFLGYLHASFPRLKYLSQLRRDPHVLGWLRFLARHDPPLRNQTRETYLALVRRLLRDLAENGQPLPLDLIRREDFPPHDRYLPRPLSPNDDECLQQQLRSRDTLDALALRLMRATGIRMGECLDLPVDCLHPMNEQLAALHVPLGKLHSERWVPVDQETQRIVTRMLQLRVLAPTRRRPESQTLLPSHYHTRESWRKILSKTLAETAQLAGFIGQVTSHRLRHTFATEMVRLGISLPALMQMLGHKDIRMTLRYVEVAQIDLHHEFQRARQNTAALHTIPQLPLPPTASVLVRADLAAIHQAIATTHHLFRLFAPQLEVQAQRKLRRLSQRLRNIDRNLDHLTQK